MKKDEIYRWIENERRPFPLIEGEISVYQKIERAIRYYYSYVNEKLNFQFNANNSRCIYEITGVSDVYYVEPSRRTLILSTLDLTYASLGIRIIDRNISATVEEVAYIKKLQEFVSADFMWEWKKPYLFLSKIPEYTTSFNISVSLDIDEVYDIIDIKDKYAIDWITRYAYALVKQHEGEILEAGSKFLGVDIGGGELKSSGQTEQKELEEKLKNFITNDYVSIF